MLHTRLREMREYKGITQKTLAQLLKISREAYSLYENDRRQMSYESLCVLADYYGVTTDFLLGHNAEGMMVMTEAEQALIHKYRNLDERGKQNIQGIMDLEYSRRDNKAKK